MGNAETYLELEKLQQQKWIYEEWQETDSDAFSKSFISMMSIQKFFEDLTNTMEIVR